MELIHMIIYFMIAILLARVLWDFVAPEDFEQSLQELKPDYPRSRRTTDQERPPKVSKPGPVVPTDPPWNRYGINDYWAIKRTDESGGILASTMSCTRRDAILEYEKIYIKEDAYEKDRRAGLVKAVKVRVKEAA